MGKAARNKTKAQANSNEVYDKGASFLQQVETNIGTLTNTITVLLGVVENMSLQLDEISSTVKGIVNNGKKVHANGKSTTSDYAMLVDSERDIVGEFHNLKQTNNVAEYQEKFEELRDLMMTTNYGLTEDYFISSFLSGLKQEIKRSIGNGKPETLYHAFDLARIKEIAIEAMKDDQIQMSLDSEEQYSPCKSVEVYIGPDNPLKFGASVGERAITFLISTGIVYSFIDTSVATHAGCKIEEAEPLLVNFLMLGYQAVSRFRCLRFKWTMQGQEFVADMRIVELKAYDMVLGGEWVHHNNPLTFSPDGIFIKKEGKELMLLNKMGSAKSEASKRM